MLTEEMGRVIVGNDYDYAGPYWCEATGGLVAGPPSRYRVTGFPRAAATAQVLVAYEGIDGPDTGRQWVCSPRDFLLKMTACPVTPPSEPEGKTAGHGVESSPY